MGAPRLRRVGTKKEFENLLDDYHTQGYEIINEGENSVLLRKKSWGNAGVHVIVGLLTVGIGNVVYALVAHYTAEQVMLKIDESRT